ncbi:MAG: S26 family signal peptidase [Polyangiales bacterium]
MRWILGVLLQWLFSLLVLVALVVVVLRVFFIDMAVVGHHAMAPTILAGDEIVIWRTQEFTVGDVAVCRHPSRMDDLELEEKRRQVVELAADEEARNKLPLEDELADDAPRLPLFGRVIAKPGVELSSERGHLTVGTERCDVDFQGELPFHDPLLGRTDRMKRGTEHLGRRHHDVLLRAKPQWRMKKHQVLAGLYVLSDNRHHPGQDSRSFGEVQPAQCIGRAVLRWRRGDPIRSAQMGHGRWDLLR